MKKIIIKSLCYILLLIVGYGRNNAVNAQYLGYANDDLNMKEGTQFARCDYDGISNKVNLQNVREALNNY